jgi:hypothetical protein
MGMNDLRINDLGMNELGMAILLATAPRSRSRAAGRAAVQDGND